MTCKINFDERYFGGYFSYSSGYYDASNPLNEIFVMSEGDIAYGTNVDNYSLSILK